MRLFRRLAPLFLLSVLSAGCDRAPQAPAASGETAPGIGSSPSAPEAAVVELQDVVETQPNYIVGISYPASAGAHPGLARALKAYADAARAELMQAVNGLGADKPTAPYDLSLAFNGLVETPRVVAVAADGSMYTGGAHGKPLVARFVWLPERGEMLTADRLLAGAAGWKAVSDASREQLMTALSRQLDEDGLEAGERAAQLRNGGRMIDAGTGPGPDNFSQFEPMMGADGRIAGLRFVFPPYQAGPYSAGTQTVEIPAALLLPHLAPDYRGLFAGG